MRSSINNCSLFHPWLVVIDFLYSEQMLSYVAYPFVCLFNVKSIEQTIRFAVEASSG